MPDCESVCIAATILSQRLSYSTQLHTNRHCSPSLAAPARCVRNTLSDSVIRCHAPFLSPPRYHSHPFHCWAPPAFDHHRCLSAPLALARACFSPFSLLPPPPTMSFDNDQEHIGRTLGYFQDSPLQRTPMPPHLLVSRASIASPDRSFPSNSSIKDAGSLVTTHPKEISSGTKKSVS